MPATTGLIRNFTQRLQRLFVLLCSLSITLFSANASAELRLEPSVLQQDGQFGFSVAIDGDTAVVGEPVTPEGGAVHIYQRNHSGINQWGLVKTLISPPISSANIQIHQFGYSVAISGDTLVVGAPQSYGTTVDPNPSGHVWVYERNRGGPDNWGLSDSLVDYRGTGGERFGHSVAISGDWIVVGEPNAGETFDSEGAFTGVLPISVIPSFFDFRTGGAAEVGRAWVYRKDYSGLYPEWTIDALLLPVPVSAGTFFGTDVDISADGNGVGVSVGAPGYNYRHGAQGLFYRSDSWKLVTGELSGPAAVATGDQYGTNLTIYNNEYGNSVAFFNDPYIGFIGGSPLADVGSSGSYQVGTAYSGSVDWEADTFTIYRPAIAQDKSPEDRMGSSVAWNGGNPPVLLTGAPLDGNDILSEDLGSVYAFELAEVHSPAQWNKFRPSAVKAGDKFGSSLDGSAEGSWIAGAPFTDLKSGDTLVPDAGAAYIYPAPGIDFTAVEGTTVREGQSIVFLVSLTSPPSGNVFLDVSIDNLEQATLDGGAGTQQLIFTPELYTVALPFVVRGVPDNTLDFTQQASVSVSVNPNSQDYLNVPGKTINIDVEDADVPTFEITPNPVVTRELGQPVTVSVHLPQKIPAGGQFSFEVSSSDETEGKVRPDLTSPNPVLTFSDTVDTQTFTVTPGLDTTTAGESTADGDVAYTLNFGPLSSNFSYLEGFDPPDLDAVNEDFGIDVVAVPGNEQDSFGNYVTTESGGTAAFDVRLIKPPTSEVFFLGYSSDDTKGVVVSDAAGTQTQTFLLSSTASQRIIVSGVTDYAVGDPSLLPVYELLFDAATSTDPRYDGLTPRAMPLINRDNGVTGLPITVEPLSSAIYEGAAPLMLTVKLAQASAEQVMVPLIPNNIDKIRTSIYATTGFDWADQTQTELVFTPGETEKPIYVYAKDDALVDFYTQFKVQFFGAVSNDPVYSGYDPEDVSLTLIDNDVPGVTIKQSTGTVVSEDGTMTAFTLSLDTKPSSTVYIELAVDPTEAYLSVDFGPPVSSTTVELYSPSDYPDPPYVVVRVYGRDDYEDDGDVVWPFTLKIRQDSDALYRDIVIDDLMFTTLDNDPTVPDIVLSPTSGTTLQEQGSPTSVDVSLSLPATAPVIVDLSVSDSSELSVSPSQVVLDSSHPVQTVMVSPVDDRLIDGDVQATLNTQAQSSDGDYNLSGTPLAFTVQDDDSADIVAGVYDSNITSESGQRQSIKIQLTSIPNSNIVVDIESTDVGEGVVVNPQLTFTPENALEPQYVQIEGQDDDLLDGNQPYQVRIFAVGGDLVYTNLPPKTVDMINQDNDDQDIHILSPPVLLVDENGAQARFSVTLGSRPTGDVSIDFSSSDLTEATVAPAHLVIAPDDAQNNHFITVTGVDDALFDGNQVFNIVASTSSGDPVFNNRNIDDIPGVNKDNESPRIDVSPVLLQMKETSSPQTVSVSLSQTPTADVTVDLVNPDPRISIDATQLVFTPASSVQTLNLTVTSVDNRFADGGKGIRLDVQPATSLDPFFNGFDPADVYVSLTDDDYPGLQVQPSVVNLVAGSQSSFEVALLSEPVADVTLTLSVTGSTGTLPVLSQGSLHFLAGDDGSPKTVTVTEQNAKVGVADLSADAFTGTFNVSIVASSTDPQYAGQSGQVTLEVGPDSTAPVITPPADLMLEATGPLTPASLGSAEVADNVDSGLTATPDNTGPFPLGDTLVTWSSTDAAGNTGSATQTVHVSDSTPPQLTIAGRNPAQVIVGESYDDAGATANDLVDGDLTAAIVVTGVVDTQISGVYTLSYEVSDAANNTARASRTIYVGEPGVPIPLGSNSSIILLVLILLSGWYRFNFRRDQGN